jgi:hypothetical protein
LKKSRETFTEEIQRQAKAFTKACPGFYKNADKGTETKIHGHYKPEAKHRIVWDEFYAKGKSVTKGQLYNVTQRGKEFKRTPKKHLYPRDRKDVVIPDWRIKKDREPGPGSYDFQPIKNNDPRPVFAKG